MAYHLIIVRDAGTWSPQFGDTDRECVVQEREDSYLRQRGYGYEGDGKYAAKDLKIISFPRVPTQRQMMERIAALNPPVSPAPSFRVIVFDENGPQDMGSVGVEGLSAFLPHD